MHRSNASKTRKGNTRNVLRDVSNRFNEDCIKHANAVKRVKSQSFRGTIGYTSSKKDCAALSTEESVDHVHLANTTLLSCKVSEFGSTTAFATSAFDHDGQTEFIDKLDSTKPILDMAGDRNSSVQKEAFVVAISKPSQRVLLPNSTAAPNDKVGLVRDIDDSSDPLLVTAYVRQMYACYRAEEHRAVVGPYLQHQHQINATMRAILIDWLCEVHHKWRLHPETLYLTVNIVDRYLAMKEVSKKTLQLVGSSALLIASKYEEIYPTPVGDLVYVCDGAYDNDEVVVMEEKMLKTLNYQISIPTIYKFLVRYLNAANPSRKLCYMSSYVAEMSLLSYDMIKDEYKPSLMAAAAVLIGRKSIGRNRWSSTLVEFSGYREEDVVPVARRMLEAMSMDLSSSTELNALKHKYGRRSKSNVADITLPVEI